MRIPIPFAFATMTVLVLAGCSNDSDDTGEKDANAATVDSPLSEYLGIDDLQFDTDSFEARQRAIEEGIAACMAEQGFAYTPVDYSSNEVVVEPETSGPEYGTREYAAINGYNLSTWADDPPMPEQEAEPFVDPNQEMLESMSREEQEAYGLALEGDNPMFNFSAAPPDMDQSQGTSGQRLANGDMKIEYTTLSGETAEMTIPLADLGCRGKAEFQAGEGSGLAWSDPKFAEMNDAVQSMYESAGQDPRIDEAARSWVGCMADAGYSDVPADPDGMFDYVSGLMEAEVDYEADDYTEAAKKFMPKEIEIATADFDCQEQVGYRDTIMKVNAEHEQKFIAENRAALDAYKQALAESQG